MSFIWAGGGGIAVLALIEMLKEKNIKFGVSENDRLPEVGYLTCPSDACLKPFDHTNIKTRKSKGDKARSRKEQRA